VKELVVLSGKGGTGKTSISASLAALLESVTLADCDVDASDLHLVLGAEIRSKEPFISGNLAEVDPEKCTACGLCETLCRFDAITLSPKAGGKALVKATGCEGCKVCVRFCPEQAIQFLPRLCGESFVSKTRLGMMCHARLLAGAENSGKLVSLVRKKARETAERQGSEWLIVDGPPGIACPVIASITGADAVLMVTEPSLSAVHDLDRVAELCRHFKLRAFCLINRCDINPAISDALEEKMKTAGVEVIGRIPFDPEFTRAQVQGLSLAESRPQSESIVNIRSALDRLKSLLWNE